MRVLPFLAFAAISLVGRAQMSISTLDVPVVQDFNIAGSQNCTAAVPWANDATIPSCYSDRPTYNYSNGCANIGGLHVAGSGGETSLGGRGSNSTTQVRWGVRFKNNTGVTLSALHISIRCEQWGFAQSNLANNVVPFAYQASSAPITDVTSGSWTNDATWNLVSFTAPTGCSGGNSAIDGNSPQYSAVKEGCLNVTLAPGDEIMLRWFDTNDPCNDHMLCVDDLSVTGLQAPELSASGATTFCAGGSVTLSVSGATGVTWSNGETTPSIIVDEAGIYTATCTTTCGTVELSQTVTVLDNPSAAIDPPGPASLCPGTSMTLTASGGTSFLWSTSETTPSIVVETAGTYTVTATTECGSDDASLTIDAQSAPTASISPAGVVPFCPGTPVTLTASGGTGFLWSNGDGTATTQIGSEGTWTVTVTSVCGTADATVVTEALPLPEALLSSSAIVLCADAEITLTATGEGTFAWSTGDTGPSISITEGGAYTVTATNSCGSASDALVITESAIAAAFTATPLSGMAPLPVDFTNESAPGDPFWDLGNGTSTDGSPTTIYTAPGTYDVVLTVTDPVTGCSAQATAIIIVTPGTSWITVPNVFTPNGDGTNDALLLHGEGIVDLECTLLNRWGQEVGHLTQVEQPWNGRTNGDPLPDGTYFYVLKALGVDGRPYELNGTVTLLR